MSIFDSLPPWVLLAASGAAVSASARVRESLFRAFSYVIDHQVIEGQMASDFVLTWLRKNSREISVRKSYLLYRSREVVTLPRLFEDEEPVRTTIFKFIATSVSGTSSNPSCLFLIRGIPVWVTLRSNGGRCSSLTVTTLKGVLPIRSILLDGSDEYAKELRESVTAEHNADGARVFYNNYRVVRVFGHGFGSDESPRTHKARTDSDTVSKGQPSGSPQHDEYEIYVKPYHNVPTLVRSDDVIPFDVVRRGTDNDAEQNLVLSPDAAGMLEDVRFMLSNRPFFAARNIPWRLGILLHGPPGTGKTSIIRAIGQKYGLPVMSFDISSFTNAEFYHRWSEMSAEFPVKIVVLEDFDSVFHGRENVAEKSAMRDALTFDAVLNTIDGLDDTSSGTILFITTNNVKTLDDAIGCYQDANGKWQPTRPGRIDVVVEMGMIGEAGKREIAARILKGMPDSLVTSALESTPETCSPAMIQNRCRELAKKYIFQARRESVGHDP